MIGDNQINLKIGDPIIVNNFSMYYGLKGIIKNITSVCHGFWIEVRYIIEITDDHILISIPPHCADLDIVKFREKRFGEILDKKI